MSCNLHPAVPKGCLAGAGSKIGIADAVTENVQPVDDDNQALVAAGSEDAPDPGPGADVPTKAHVLLNEVGVERRTSPGHARSPSLNTGDVHRHYLQTHTPLHLRHFQRSMRNQRNHILHHTLEVGTSH